VNLKKILWPDANDCTWNDWRWQFKNRLRGTEGLKKLGALFKKDLSHLDGVIRQYKWASTPYYLNLIQDTNLHADPIGRQIIPSLEEERKPSHEFFDPDPLKERLYSPIPGLIHRYKDRIVILASGICASYCRHCNRKRTWKRREHISLGNKTLELIKEYLTANPRIREVLISGGDPLMLPLSSLKRLLFFLRSLATIQVIRIGTRVPVVLPMRINEEVCSLLKACRPLWLNTHFNHPREITPEASRAIDKIQLAGIPVSNQTVLLKGVNDNFETLHSLFCKLQSVMVRPYYLFQCDQVMGTRHFWVPLSKGIGIMKRMWGDTGGMCMPNFVADLPGGYGKARLLPSHLLEMEAGKECIFYTFEGKIVKVKYP